MKVREPVARPLDVVAVELLLSASQAFLVGVLMYLAIGVWDERGVGLGPVAVVLALLGLGVGASWLYWLLGGVGWPMAAANLPAAMFLGFALVLGWVGDDLFRVEGIPLLFAVAAAVYGVVGGVFIDSPRRWRWDQRQKLRPGTKVPRVSETTRALVAAVPRSLPRRVVEAPGPTSELAARIEQSAMASAEPSADIGIPHAAPGETLPGDAPPTPIVSAIPDTDEAVVEPSTSSPARATAPAKEPVRAVAVSGSGEREPVSIELPTSVEPRAQRSPWAWAAPPAWNRDEDDELAGRPSKRA